MVSEAYVQTWVVAGAARGIGAALVAQARIGHCIQHCFFDGSSEACAELSRTVSKAHKDNLVAGHWVVQSQLPLHSYLGYVLRFFLRFF